MRLVCFAIYDSKVGAYMQPFFQQSKGSAIRGFTDVANDSTSGLFKHPEDYTLFELGSFDDSTAQFELYDTPVSCGVAVEFKTVTLD